ncbi:hypothetical protein [uncultured Duncaniella sp.]|uniref:hypothetical protein n=1 Tax=uncultured Duncaniella sp. TaxID=2768039 RepID=UPI00262EA08C|nr:hypothetical protein [uncultured Duncaniella sp.]
MKKGSPIIIIIIAIAIVAIVSLLPLSKWSGGRIKDFSLVSDILKEVGIMEGEPSYATAEQIDPALLEAEEESKPALPAPGEPIDTIISPVKPSRVGELVQVEDYTTIGVGFANLKGAIANGGLARIAVVGDSYIEGDIFTQDLRELFQEAYGGEGVGFVNMHTDFPGFRRSVKQSGSGWKTFTGNKKADRRYLDIAEQYSVPTGTATAEYEGTKATEHTKSWSCSRFLFISPEDVTISVKTDDSEWEERNIAGSPSVQSLEVTGQVSKFGIKTAATSLIGLGVWLDGTSGVSVDCMSSRGFSGVTLTKVSPDLSHEMAEFIDYDLIILEFGINAMSASQKDYSVYCSRMVDVINHVRLCYPQADILLMGVGDRGEKVGSQVKSMATAQAMITAQRDAARRAHCLFWDTREAMGGENAVVEWSSTGLINKDYIHLTHKGGARLARELFNAIQKDLQ